MRPVRRSLSWRAEQVGTARSDRRPSRSRSGASRTPSTRASVADLFPGYTLPELTFVPDAKVLGFTEPVQLADGQPRAHGAVRGGGVRDRADCRRRSDDAHRVRRRGDRTRRPASRPYLDDFGKRAYRRPLTAARKATALLALLARDAGTIAYPTRLAMVVQAVLMSPKFLFRAGDRRSRARGRAGHPADVVGDRHAALVLPRPDRSRTPSWRRRPTRTRSRTPDDVVTQARRLLALAARAVAAGEASTRCGWAPTRSSALAKEEHAFPDFTPLLAYYMGEGDRPRSCARPCSKTGGTFAELLLAGLHLWEQGRWPTSTAYRRRPNDWDRVQLNPSQRVGPADPGVAARDDGEAGSHRPGAPREVHPRIRSSAGTSMPPSPEIVAMFQPLDLSKTAREQFTHHRTNTVCASCHQFLDPLGLPFEHYDGMGKWRDTDRGHGHRRHRRAGRRGASTAFRRWRRCWPTARTRGAATRRSGCGSPTGRLEVRRRSSPTSTGC